MKNEKRISIKSLFSRYIINLSVLFLIVVFTVPVFMVLDISFSYTWAKYVAFGIIGVSIVFFALSLYHYSKKIYTILYKDVFTITERNLNRLKDHEQRLDTFASKDYLEIQDINQKIDKVNQSLSHSIAIAGDVNYSDIFLDYLSMDRRLVATSSFHQNLVDIIYASKSYRNILIQAYYPFDDMASMTDEEVNHLVDVLLYAFNSYPHPLCSPSQHRDGVYLYLPQIDSISDIKEKIASIQSDASIIRQGNDGSLVTLPIHFALVCYPYSNIDEIFDDIHFAKRMGKMVNEYFPKRLTKVSDKNYVMQESTNLNTMTKALSLIATMPISIAVKNRYEKLREALNNFNFYLNIDQSGVILFDDVKKTFETIVNAGKSEIKTLTEGNLVPSEIITILDEIKDDDSSYFTSSRLHLSAQLGEYFDRLGIQSGYFYLVHGDDGNLMGAIYFVNHDHDFLTDSYLRESILMVATKIADYLLTKMRQDLLLEENAVTAAVLKLSDYAMYKVNPKTYQIMSVSQGIIDALHQNIKYGDICYKQIYGRDTPCEKCPLITGQKMTSRLEPWEIQTSLTLNNEMSAERDKILLIRRMPDEILQMDDPYDSNLLVNSYYTLIQTMKNFYLLNGRGYLLLLKIDNQMELVQKFGSEATTTAIRNFAEKIRSFETINNVYVYRPDTLAIVLSEYGQIDAVNECEAIFELNRTSLFEDKETLFKITYLPISYPQGYPTALDFLRHADNYYSSGKYELNKNFIYFDESNYARSANKNEFMLSVIDDKFTNKDFTVNLQPLVRTSTGKIFGAELLLRLSDDYRKIVFNTDQLIKVAAANGKISLISSALLDYIADIYNQYGATIFKAYGFERITLNTDYSYLSDDTLIQKITNLFETTHMPKGFLGFEITEREIYNHYDDMKKFMSSLLNLGVIMICDRYNGEYLSFNRLSELGVTEFKIDRDYTRFIDTDKAKYNMVRSLLVAAKDANIKGGLIGVENMEQYKMIKDVNPDSYLQGYAFFKPMDKTDLVETVRKHNTSRMTK